MRTQKQILEVAKTVRVTVMSFENGLRYSTYGNLDIITALQEVARRTAEGRKVLLIDPEKDDSTLFEIKNKCRIHYSEAMKYIVTRENILFKGYI